jgi:hypothetical protein
MNWSTHTQTEKKENIKEKNGRKENSPGAVVAIVVIRFDIPAPARAGERPLCGNKTGRG